MICQQTSCPKCNHRFVVELAEVAPSRSPAEPKLQATVKCVCGHMHGEHTEYAPHMCRIARCECNSFEIFMRAGAAGPGDPTVAVRLRALRKEPMTAAEIDRALGAGPSEREALEQQATYYFSEIRKFSPPLNLDHYSLENWKDFIVWREAAVPQASPDAWLREFPCKVIHQGTLNGSTCLTCRQHAVANPTRYGKELLARYTTWDRTLFCDNCWSWHLLFDGAAAVPAPGRERTEKDYAIEFGGYLANAAEQFQTAYNVRRLQEDSEEEVDIDAFSDIFRALSSAIYEFRKRAARLNTSEVKAQAKLADMREALRETAKYLERVMAGKSVHNADEVLSRARLLADQ